MNPISKVLISLGVLLIVMGIAWHFGSKIIPLGKLPGDIAIERENFRFYFPVATSILLSLLLSLIVYLIQTLRK